MQDYDIQTDLTDQRRDYLKFVLLITLWVAVFIDCIRANMMINPFRESEWPVWLGLPIVLASSNELRRRGRIALGSWVYLLGVLAILSVFLFEFGPGPDLYLGFLGIMVLAFLLVDRKAVPYLSALILGLMYVLTVQHNGVLPTIPLLIMPTAFAVLLNVVLNIHAANALEMVYWATDIQRKDTRRAEEFYQQKEQLNDALLQVKHAKSKLEIMNVKLEEARNQSERASKAKSVFLSNMSHELRTPLNVIIGYTSSMLDMPEMYDGQPLPPAYQSDIQLIKDNGYYLLNLINDILDLSKIEAGKLELHCAPADMAELFRGVMATSIGLVKDKPLQIRPDFPDDLPAVWADAMRVRQIILNLMSNAIKFTPSGSVTLQARAEVGNVRVSVIDTGIGIPEHALAHIFDRFEQAERDTDKHYGGTGLGLDISKQLARMHGGDLTVQSMVGQGSTFSFTLPIMENAESAALPEQTQPAESHARTLIAASDMLASTVLLVEDEASLRDMMRRTLEGAGHVVVDVQDGSQVLDLASGLLPELIILDIRLPNVNGWELLAELKSDAETSAIPVIVCTVSDDPDRARELGAALYLQKPFSSDELLACVEAFLPQTVITGKGEA
jgi:signal transduction histidine kinase/ActR/RegA family two-component response regulator